MCKMRNWDFYSILLAWGAKLVFLILMEEIIKSITQVRTQYLLVFLDLVTIVFFFFFAGKF